MATRIQEGGGGMGSSGSKVFKKTPTVLTKAKIAKADAKKAEAKAAVKAAKSKPPIATPKSGVKVIKPGTKPLTKPTSAYITGQPMSGVKRGVADLRRMGYTTKELKGMGLLP